MTRHGASVKQLRAAAAKISDASADIAEAAALAQAFATAARSGAGDDLVEIQDEAIDPVYKVIQHHLDAVTDITKARAETAEKINAATASALLSFDAADRARPRIVEAAEALFEAIGAVNKATGPEVLAVLTARTEATATAVALGPCAENLRDPFLEILGEPGQDPPSLHLNTTNFGAWLAFGDDAARGAALDALIEVRRAAAALRTAATGLRKPARRIERVRELSDAMPDAGELLEAWVTLGEAIVAEGRRHLELAAGDEDS